MFNEFKESEGNDLSYREEKETLIILKNQIILEFKSTLIEINKNITGGGVDSRFYTGRKRKQ